MVTASQIFSAALSTPYWVASSLYARRRGQKGNPPLFLFGFAKWKTFMADWFPDHDVIFVPNKLLAIEFEIEWKWRIIADPRSIVLAWQYKSLPNLKKFCNKNNIKFQFVEDGFLRSVALGALQAPPISLTFDSQDMYFNSRAPSDLEDILNTYDFKSDTLLIDRARTVIDILLSTKLSKYNSSSPTDVAAVYGPKVRKRVLVIGQVERDASIKYGCNVPINNNDLVWLAIRENPDAQIIYKPHPEVLQGTAEAKSNPDLVRGVALVLDNDISLADSLETIDHVYTITSLAGFEALLRRIPVTTFGCPFYSGWGLTDDRQINERRGRKLTLEEIFAAAYIIYPKYIDLNTKKRIEIEKAIELLDFMKARTTKDFPADKEVEARASKLVSMLGKSDDCTELVARFLGVKRVTRPKLDAFMSALNARLSGDRPLS
ncbi:capsular polysaccharide export protein [Rhizobium sp. OAE497]